MSIVTPFSASWLRTPHQSPLRVERVQRSPEYGVAGGASPAPAVTAKAAKWKKMKTKMAENLFIRVAPFFNLIEVIYCQACFSATLVHFLLLLLVPFLLIFIRLALKFHRERFAV